MNRTSYTLILALILLAGQPLGIAATGHTHGNSSSITLEEIFRSQKFVPETLEGLKSMNDGEHYTVQHRGRIDQYSYRNGDWVETLFDIFAHTGMMQFDDYHFSMNEEKILIETGHEKIYRHSYRANYHVYDRSSGRLVPLSSNGKQQLATFSPDGGQVAFVRDNNLYIRDLSQTGETQITFDGVKNQVINGAPDWVYEEEFGFSRGFDWSPDGLKIAFYRFDESRVKQFHITMFGSLYPESYEFKYPKAGEENSVVSILVYDLESGTVTTMETGRETDQYIPRIKWTRDPNTLSIMRLNRLQNQLDILHADASTGESAVVYHEENPKYISEASDNTVTYLEDGEHFILNSERDGYFHLYLYNFITGEIKPITSGAYDVHSFLGHDEKSTLLYYTSYEESTIERHLYSIRLDGTKKRRISTRAGDNSATFSTTYKYYILHHTSTNSPGYITLHKHGGKEVRVLVDNARLKKTMKAYGFANTEFLTVPTASGEELNGWMIKPADFDPTRKYPLFVYVYGGPESQKVIDKWGGNRALWFQMLVSQGYIVACVDNRGTNGRGEEFRKATYMSLGKLETIDQLEAAQWFGSQDYIDANRMGIFGWSYGGFMTSLCMTKGKGTFKYTS